MKERPIIFSTEMVKAIMEGRKTQTRRVIKPQPRSYDDYMNSGEQALGFNTGRKSTMVIPDIEEAKRVMPAWCPYGQVGDRLWVRETFYTDEYMGPPILYKADGRAACFNYGGPWCPSIHMPRWASRLILGITGIRAERLQEITLEDCKAEGIKGYTFARGCLSNNPPDARWAFIRLWDSLNAKPKPRYIQGKIAFYKSYPWDDIQETRTYRGKPWYVHGNPWVWAIEFPNIVKTREGGKQNAGNMH